MQTCIQDLMLQDQDPWSQDQDFIVKAPLQQQYWPLL